MTRVIDLLDPVARAHVLRAAELSAELPEGTWPDRRRGSRISARLFAELGATPPGRVAIRDIVWKLPGRTLVAREYRAHPPNRGVIVLVHGGGYAFGAITDIATEAFARSRALGTGAVVVDVGYRLAPEHPFPAAVDDIRDAIRRIRDEIPEAADGLVVDGVSSGAGIAAGAVLELGAAGDAPLTGLVLEVPSVDLRPDAPWIAAYNAVAGLMPRDRVREFYLQGADPADPRASPAAGNLSLLPPTHVVTAEFDPLRDVGERFAESARAAGVAVTAERYPRMAHGTLELVAGSSSSRRWHAEVETAIRALVMGSRARAPADV